MANIRLQGSTFHARLTIPKDVKHHFNDKSEFSKSLETGDRKLALVRCAETVAQWKRDIHSARNGNDVSEWTRSWISHIKNASTAVNDEFEETDNTSERDDALFVLTDELENQIASGRVSESHAIHTFKVITGERLILQTQKQTYLKQFRNRNAKTQAAYATAISRFCLRFEDSSKVTTKSIHLWLTDMADEEEMAAKTIARMFNQARNFWDYLHDHGLVKDKPFDDIKNAVPKSAKTTLSYEPFTPAEVVALLHHPKAANDPELQFLIQLGMYTGARIEEIAMLKASDVMLDDDYLLIRGTKTAAAHREVPIHPTLRPLLEATCNSDSEFVINGLTIDKRGERGKAIGKRFGRLKTEMGFTIRAKSFHSIRKTVATLFERAVVPEGVAADILGHEKKTITYGLYSGGTSMEQKRDAIHKLSYPAPAPVKKAA